MQVLLTIFFLSSFIVEHSKIWNLVFIDLTKQEYLLTLTYVTVYVINNS